MQVRFFKDTYRHLLQPQILLESILGITTPTLHPKKASTNCAPSKKSARANTRPQLGRKMTSKAGLKNGLEHAPRNNTLGRVKAQRIWTFLAVAAISRLLFTLVLKFT